MESVKLALKGGPREINGENEKIFHWPIVTEEDFEAVKAVIADGGKPSCTDITMEFEKEWAAYNGVKYALTADLSREKLKEVLGLLAVQQDQ